MDSYYEGVNEYYRELNGATKCKGCKEAKTFKENKGVLSFSCGGKHEKCSRQIKIELSRFIEYNDTLHEFQIFLKRNNTTGKNKSIKKELEDILKLGKKQLIENNNITNKQKLIHDYNDLKIKTKIEQCKLLHDINDKDYIGNVDKQELSNRYYTLNKVLGEKYNEILELYERPVNNYVMIHKGKVL